MDSNQPLVSIIIPTYNRAHLISETLDSILEQTYQNWECIIVDDGSIDITEKVVSKYINKDARFQYHHRPSNRSKGANSCRNYGFELSRGEYVNWFDSDDVMLKDFIKVKIEAFREGIDFVFCSVYYVDDKLNIIKSVPLHTDGNIFKDFILLKQAVLTPSILFRKSSIANQELYLIQLSRGQEMEFLSRLFFNLTKDKYVVINEPHFLYRQHENSVSGKSVNYINSYKESLAYIYASNLKRGFILKDSELIRYNYTFLFYLLSEAVDKRHFRNFRFILDSMFKIFYRRNFVLFIKLFSIYSILFLLGRKSYYMERYFKNAKIKY